MLDKLRVLYECLVVPQEERSSLCVKEAFSLEDKDSSGGNRHVGGFSHTCVENGKHLQTYIINCVAFFTH